jgi:hypothetical protein
MVSVDAAPEFFVVVKVKGSFFAITVTVRTRSVESFCEVTDCYPVVVDDRSDRLDDASMVRGVIGVATSAERGRQDALLAPAVEGPQADIEFGAEFLGCVHDS